MSLVQEGGTETFGTKKVKREVKKEKKMRSLKEARWSDPLTGVKM